MNPSLPPPWLIFLITCVALSLVIGLIVVVGGLSRMARGASFWPPREGHAAGNRPSLARSHVRHMWVRRGAGVRTGSRGVNAEVRQQDGAFAGSEGSRSGSEVRESSPTIDPDLPQNVDELVWAMEAVRLRTSGEESTKEAAIIRAFPHVSSKGGGSWQRASKLYDVVWQAQKVRSPTPTLTAQQVVAETA